MADKDLRLRGSKFYLTRWIPKKYESVAPTQPFRKALGTSDKDEARVRAAAIWAEALAEWEAKLTGGRKEDEWAYQNARARARQLGLRYLPADEVAKLPLGELIARIHSADSNISDATALLGLAAPPKIRLSDALEAFWELAEDRLAGKSDDQLRRHRNARKRAFGDLIGVITDLPVEDLTRSDAMDFREWLGKRIKAGDISPGTANKQLHYISGVLTHVAKMKGLEWPRVFSELTFQERVKKTRKAFSTAWIRDVILAPGALAGLNVEARTAVLMMVNTGARPSEIVSLRADHIHLDGDIPLLEILPDGRQLKNRNSMRSIPLAGVSLAALKDYGVEGRDGPIFPRYADKDKISAAVNKYFKAHGLKETPEHTLYGLRHAFEDRMIAAGVDERVRSDLFGHDIQRERYGDGGGDAVRYRAVQAIAL